MAGTSPIVLGAGAVATDLGVALAERHQQSLYVRTRFRLLSSWVHRVLSRFGYCRDDVAIDPERMRRRARLLRPLGILVTIGGAAMLLGGIFLLATDPVGSFDVFWLPFVGGFVMFPGILMWVAGNLARASADFASSMPPTPHGLGVPAFRACQRCGNANAVTERECQVCGAKLS